MFFLLSKLSIYYCLSCGQSAARRDPKNRVGGQTRNAIVATRSVAVPRGVSVSRWLHCALRRLWQPRMRPPPDAADCCRWTLFVTFRHGVLLRVTWPSSVAVAPSRVCSPLEFRLKVCCFFRGAPRRSRLTVSVFLVSVGRTRLLSFGVSFDRVRSVL